MRNQRCKNHRTLDCPYCLSASKGYYKDFQVLDKASTDQYKSSDLRIEVFSETNSEIISKKIKEAVENERSEIKRLINLRLRLYSDTPLDERGNVYDELLKLEEDINKLL